MNLIHFFCNEHFPGEYTINMNMNMNMISFSLQPPVKS